MDQLRFYTDEHIDFELIKQLRRYQIDVLTCQEAGLLGASDDVHLNYASDQRRLIITCDRDFVRLDATWSQLGRSHTGIVYMHQHVCNNIGLLIGKVLFWQAALNANAATLEGDFWNRVLHIT